MRAIAIRECNANVSRAVALAETGETIDGTKNGRIVAKLRPKTAGRSDDPEWRAAYAAMIRCLRLVTTGKAAILGCRYPRRVRGQHVGVLLTADLQAGRRIGRVTVLDPFKPLDRPRLDALLGI